MKVILTKEEQMRVTNYVTARATQNDTSMRFPRLAYLGDMLFATQEGAASLVQREDGSFELTFGR